MEPDQPNLPTDCQNLKPNQVPNQPLDAPTEEPNQPLDVPAEEPNQPNHPPDLPDPMANPQQLN